MHSEVPGELSQLIPYLPPMVRDAASCVCGWYGWGTQQLCAPCRDQAVRQHGTRLADLLSTITYDHRGVRLSWSKPDTEPTAFTPRVRFTTTDVHNPQGPAVQLGWFEEWADDQLIGACANGADDMTLLALAVAQAHYAVATLAVHEVGEWFTDHDRQVYPPHRPDPDMPGDEDNGPDGNGDIVLWFNYHPPASSTTPSIPVRDCPVQPEGLGTLPGQQLRLSPHGITITPPQESQEHVAAWTAPQPGQPPRRGDALRDIHHAMVMSELTVVATHLQLAGVPIFAAGGHGIAYTAQLTYDG